VISFVRFVGVLGLAAPSPRVQASARRHDARHIGIER